MRGILVYERQTAAERKWYIDRYLKGFEAEGIEFDLCYDCDCLKRAEDGEIDFAIMRKIDPSLNKSLEDRKVRVFNSARLSETANDKGKSYELADILQIPSLGYTALGSAGRDMEFPMVAKSVDGHGGTEVFLIEDEAALKALKNGADAGRYILQPLCDEPGIDMRVYVIGGRIIAAMRRENKNLREGDSPLRERFKSNFCLGGRAEAIEPPEYVREYAETLCGFLPMDFAGIDFIRHKGRWIFNEIEDVVGARMLYSYTDMDVVSLYIKYICSQL